MTLMRPFSGLLLCLAAAACAPKESAPAQPSNRATFSERINQKHGYTRDKNGQWIPTTNKRSSFETVGNAPYFKGDVDGKPFPTKSYSKKEWSGLQEFQTKPFDKKTNSEFSSKKSRFEGRQAAIEQEASDVRKVFSTKDYATHQAIESDTEAIDKPSDAETDVRRRTYVQPDVIDYKQQRQMTVDQSKSLLGR